MKNQKLEALVIVFAWLAVVYAATAILLILGVGGCIDAIEPSGDTGACERFAARFGATECGVVYQFPIPAQTPSGFIEFCIPPRDGLLELAETMYGPSEPSPRFPIPALVGAVVDPPCAYQCPTKMGCNSYVDPVRHLGGCFCPEASP